MNNVSKPYFEILAPAQWTTPIIINSPHSGTVLPTGFLAVTQLAESDLHSSEDSHVDELFMGCRELGIPLLRALVSRSYLDLNREPFELDARMFDEPLPSHMNTSSPRVASGLGTIPKIVGEGVNIYAGPISLQDALQRIESIHRPYHRTLAALVNEAYAATNIALLIDCHSMPATAVSKQHNTAARIDIVLGDRFGHACDPEITGQVTAVLESAGLSVARNKPYSGGFITECHGHPRRGRHALQIEINRSLYMNEVTRQPNHGFAPLKAILNNLVSHLAGMISTMAQPDTTKIAAE